MEELILSHLLTNDKYARAVIPHLKTEYLDRASNKLLYGMIHAFFTEYGSLPTKEALLIELDKKKGVPEGIFNEAKAFIKSYKPDTETEYDWLIDTTEQFCQQQALFGALVEATKIMKDENGDATAIPAILQKALEVSFEVNIGHDFLKDKDKRFEAYHAKEKKLDFDIDILNKITRGGFPNKSLNILMAPPGVGKTLHMCHYAAHHLIMGKNVLYITLEMAEERIGQRIDQNLMGITSDQLESLTKLEFDKNIERIRETTKGTLKIKEYAPGAISAGHIRLLLSEFENKEKFKPDIIYVDYLNLLSSNRLKLGQVNSYSYVKAIAEELRAISVELGPPIVSATQANRDAVGSSDVGMENVSESMGLPQTADFILAIIATEDLDEFGQMMYKQIKNRYNDINYYRRFVVGVDKPRMRLYNVEESAQENITEDKPVMDNGAVMEREEENKKFDNNKFKGFF